ncbi:MAG: RidA family protein [Planctomycetes bacterium]|nr:RidA family protein [Planctomycetota bacterium]
MSVDESSNVEEKLKRLGLELPAAPPPAANYKRCVRVGNLAFFSGQLPWADGKMQYAGHVGSELTDEEGYQAARLCALNALAQIKAEFGSFDPLETIVRVEGHVNSAPGWTGHPQVLNGASDLFAEVLGARAGHARTALGHNELPLNAAVEIVFIVAVKGS